MRKLVHLLCESCVGALLGVVLCGLGSRGIVAWYNIPVAPGAMCPCEPVVRDTIHSVLHTQLLGGAIGAVIVVLCAELALSRLRGSRQPTNSAVLPKP